MDFLPTELPRHIGIIMDGNGRWAQLRNKPRIWGHRMGVKTVDIITSECARLGIQQLTLYAFSSENWQRPGEEVTYLKSLLRRFLLTELRKLQENNIRFNAIGKLDRLPIRVQDAIEHVRDRTSHNTGMTLCLALSYGGRLEIVDLAKALARKVIAGEIAIEDIDETLCQANLYQPDMPDLDLLIRTGGEMRISNFLLWQVSYAELWITPLLWPDFTEQYLHQAIVDFNKRERRFGKVPCQKALATTSV